MSTTVMLDAKQRYLQEVLPELQKKLGYSNVMQIPKIEKIVVGVGLGEAVANVKALEAAERDISTITGQHPVITKARRSIATYKLRAGMPIGIMVTLRGRRMYDFFDRLVGIVLPRIRDFRGISPNSFDGRGNYNLGIKEQIIFADDKAHILTA